MKRWIVAPILAVLLVAAAPTAIPVGASPPTGDFQTTAWVQGKPVILWEDLTRPLPDRRQAIYAVGPHDTAHPHVEGFDDEPDHDHVVANIPYGRRARCHAWAVIPNDGPFATSVHVREGGLAYEIDLGHGFVPLTSTDVVVDGLADGLLRLVDSGFPDFTCWVSRNRS